MATLTILLLALMALAKNLLKQGFDNPGFRETPCITTQKTSQFLNILIEFTLSVLEKQF